jgi:hypothetical protein
LRAAQRGAGFQPAASAFMPTFFFNRVFKGDEDALDGATGNRVFSGRGQGPALSRNARLTVLPVTKQQAICARGDAPPCQEHFGSFLAPVSRARSELPETDACSRRCRMGDQMSETDSAAAGQPTEQAVPLPPASFSLLVLSLRMQAEMQLGLVHFGEEKDRPELDLGGARHAIDLLAILQEKTKGNLTIEEQRLLENSLTELRFRYVQAVEDKGKPSQP